MQVKILKFLVVGAGGQGAPCASILSRDPEVSEIVLADIDLELAKKVSRKIGSDKITITRVDAGNLEDLLNAAKGVDAIINLTLPRFNSNIKKAALKSGAHYVDTAFDEKTWKELTGNKPLEFDKEFKKAGLTAVIGCGGSPGITNVLVRYVCDKLDSVDKIRLVMGGKPSKEPEEVVEAWDPGWCPDVAIDDYAEKPVIFENGEYKRYLPFSGLEEYKFPDPVGPRLVTRHSHEEPLTLPRFIGKGVKNVDFMYPLDIIAGALVKLGFASYDTINVKGVKVAPRDVLLSLVRRPVNSFFTENESTVVTPPEYIWSMVIEIDGEKAGYRLKYTLTQGSTETSADEKLKMFRRLGTTDTFVAAPAITAAKMCIKGNVDRGVIAPEGFDPVIFLKMMVDMGVPVKFREIVSKSVTIA
ncbi:MAG: saccharopine dehydrogenase NADP-binding domain-containing protein [Candidatus Bathyarchaeota archaeon]|nr:MAG: saccharopine dehydrogenase NADP-binding domain-containing protein [Candidatus Bathyarchaeota archaeon]